MKNIRHYTLIWLLSLLVIGMGRAAEKVAVATKVSGLVNLTKSAKAKSKSSTLQPGAILEDGDFIKTGGDGFVALVFIDDKSSLKIKENTELEITGKRQAASIAKKINLDHGTLRAQVTKQVKGDFIVATPTSVASVKGTDFWMISDPIQGDQLIGLNGVVELMNVFSGMAMDITGGFTGNSLADGGLTSDVTIPETIPDDPDEETEQSKKSILKIQFQGPDNTVKTLIIEYQ
ncbi:MAG: FecR family protein [Candidatus Neomarinimicrobiota bacterium]